MHTFRYSNDLNHILFEDLYPYINQLSEETNGLNNPILKVELIADIIAFSIMSILLEHSNLNEEEQYNKIKQMPLPICGYGGENHPPGKLRINTLRIIPHIYEVLSQTI